jgi:hypothetical protein
MEGDALTPSARLPSLGHSPLINRLTAYVYRRLKPVREATGYERQKAESRAIPHWVRGAGASRVHARLWSVSVTHRFSGRGKNRMGTRVRPIQFDGLALMLTRFERRTRRQTNDAPTKAMWPFNSVKQPAKTASFGFTSKPPEAAILLRSHTKARERAAGAKIAPYSDRNASTGFTVVARLAGT